jgi:long-chain acyl-CoA synthetase
VSVPAPPLWELTGRSPSDEALADARRSLTWADLEHETNALGHGLAGLGVGPGDHVAVVATNRVEFVVAVLAALRAGLVVTPVKTGWTCWPTPAPPPW